MSQDSIGLRDHGRHVVLRRGLRPLVAEAIRAHTLRQVGGALSSPASRVAEPGPLASPQGHGLGIDAYHRSLIEHVESLIELLGGADLQLRDLERYERALVRGHAANLRRLPHLLKKER